MSKINSDVLYCLSKLNIKLWIPRDLDIDKNASTIKSEQATKNSSTKNKELYLNIEKNIYRVVGASNSLINNVVFLLDDSAAQPKLNELFYKILKAFSLSDYAVLSCANLSQIMYLKPKLLISFVGNVSGDVICLDSLEKIAVDRTVKKLAWEKLKEVLPLLEQNNND